MLIKCDRILTENGFLDGYLKTEGFNIKEILAKEAVDEVPDVDYSNNIIIPGLIDIHLHGYRGRINPALGFDLPEFRLFLNDLAYEGTTACLPSIEPESYHIIRDYRQHANESVFLGCNLEAYFSCDQYKSYRNPYGLARELSLENVRRLLNDSNQTLRYVMIAPELPHAQSVIRFLKEQGVRVAIGHTTMSAQDFIAFQNTVQADSLTHWGNNMGKFHQRDVGVIGAGLLDDRLQAELITDFVHLSKEMVEVALRIKSIQRCILISDSVFLSGLPSQSVHFDENHSLTITSDHKILDQDGNIQGCYHTLFQNLVTLVKSGLVTLQEAVIAASMNPAKFLKADHVMGSIKEGKYANFLVINHELELLKSYVYGNPVVRK